MMIVSITNGNISEEIFSIIYIASTNKTVIIQHVISFEPLLKMKLQMADICNTNRQSVFKEMLGFQTA